MKYIIDYRKAEAGEKFLSDIGYDIPRIITSSVKTPHKVLVILAEIPEEIVFDDAMKILGKAKHSMICSVPQKFKEQMQSAINYLRTLTNEYR